MSILVTAPINKEVTVAADQERAFEVFTARIGDWWPLRTHSVGLEEAESLSMECRPGGRLIETYGGGKEAEWGRVLAWDPPARIVFTWYPGRPGEAATEIEVTFVALSASETRVRLEHRGWETLPSERRAGRAEYVTGWDFVLGHFVTHVASE